MPTIVLTRLADLRAGDVILSLDGRRYRTPLRVTDALGPIAPGSPVHGVRLEPPNPASGIERVFYPSQMDGHRLEVERPAPLHYHSPEQYY